MADPEAFIICQIGDEGSSTRQRADELLEYVIEPATSDFDMKLLRSDKDPTPGQVTSRIIRSLLNSDVVIADLTGRNPNVYYELGVAHSFGRPVVILVDTADSLTFDTQNERVIEVGDSGAVIGARQAQHAADKLRKVLKVVLGDEYRPSSLVTEAADAQSLAALAPDNPVASELETIRERLDLIYARIVRRGEDGDEARRADIRALVRFLRGLVAEERVEAAELALLIDDDTSDQFDSFIEHLIDELGEDLGDLATSVTDD